MVIKRRFGQTEAPYELENNQCPPQGRRFGQTRAPILENANEDYSGKSTQQYNVSSRYHPTAHRQEFYSKNGP